MKKKRTSALVAKISVAATSLFLLLLLLLHFLKPEMSPSWRMISEYEIGRFGWLMQVAFFSLAGGTVLLALTLRSQVQSVAGYIGLVLLFVIAVGLVMGGIFITEPITTPRDEISMVSQLHNVGGSLAIFPIPFASILISLSLIRLSEKWTKVRLLIISLAAAIWLSLGWYIMVAAITYTGEGSADVPVGWPNRAFIVAYALWVIVVAQKVVKVSRQAEA